MPDGGEKVIGEKEEGVKAPHVGGIQTSKTS